VPYAYVFMLFRVDPRDDGAGVGIHVRIRSGASTKRASLPKELPALGVEMFKNYINCVLTTLTGSTSWPECYSYIQSGKQRGAYKPYSTDILIATEVFHRFGSTSDILVLIFTSCYLDQAVLVSFPRVKHR